jgi:four helix bundle protein
VGARSFEELKAWQLASRLSDEVVAVCAMSALEADLDFRSQLRRAAEAAPRLIAEGFGRWSHREFARYLVMTRAELMEVRSDLRALQRRRALDTARIEELLELEDHARRTVDRLRASLSK